MSESAHYWTIRQNLYRLFRGTLQGITGTFHVQAPVSGWRGWLLTSLEEEGSVVFDEDLDDLQVLEETLMDRGIPLPAFLDVESDTVDIKALIASAAPVYMGTIGMSASGKTNPFASLGLTSGTTCIVEEPPEYSILPMEQESVRHEL